MSAPAKTCEVARMACLGLPDLLRIAESGLAAVPGAADHVAGCAACAAALGAQVRANRAEDDAGAEQLGRYQLLGERGRGAFGRVFEAYDPALDRRVAVKMIAFTTRSSSVALTELLREAKAMAQIQHPNVIPIFDAGRTADGVFITMPIVDGETLDTWAQRRRARAGGIDADRVIAMFAAKAAAGLSAIHAAGFVHRDIKPSNVLVAGTDAWIADLGLARRTTRATSMTDVFGGGELTASMHTESFGGTPAYMAPECLAGGAATPAADQYALAVTLVEILTGQRPFAATTYSELLDAASTRPPRLEGIPRRYHAALSRALRPDPGERFPSVAAFATALAAARPRRGSRPRAAVLAIVPALVVAGGWLWSSRAGEPALPAGSAVEPRLPSPDAASIMASPDAASIPASPVASPTSRCTDRCVASHQRAMARCPGDEVSCRATGATAFAACTGALDAGTCDGLRSRYVQACVGHEVAIDAGCGERGRACSAACRTSARQCEAAGDEPAASPEDCRTAWLRCREAAAARLAPLERARRGGWDDCAAANAACRAGATPDTCGDSLRRCNAAVAAEYERGKELVDREDQRCLTAQQACFARRSSPTSPARDDCRMTAESCLAGCARAEYDCVARPVPSRACSAAADAALAACRRACAP
jgi:serine/threonine protein kinase